MTQPLCTQPYEHRNPEGQRRAWWTLYADTATALLGLGMGLAAWGLFGWGQCHASEHRNAPAIWEEEAWSRQVGDLGNPSGYGPDRASSPRIDR